MKKIICAILAVAFVLPATHAVAKTRHHVVIHKSPSQGTRQQQVFFLAFIAPPVLVAYDLQRRTNCVGDSAGLGGPGFDRPVLPTDNALITAYQRGLCSAQPKQSRRM